ncbi:MAG: DUF364 domain-containing protein [Eubacteriales bacterium]|nr:DUF364 domain-containing protein [Eubacteriales bacterium]
MKNLTEHLSPAAGQNTSMSDLQQVLSINRGLYEAYQEEMPIVKEFVMGYRWMMASDTKDRISLCLRVGQEKPAGQYEAILRSLIGKPADVCLEELFATNDPELRTIAAALTNLMSKPFNSAKRLADRGILRSEGLHFPYDVAGKKVGIVGYGLYNNFFLGKCAQFHAFDLRRPQDILSRRIGQETQLYPEGIHWHLGQNATDFPDVLEQLDIIIMTGCTIVNGTYQEILKACRNAGIRGIYGPSAELAPEYLFDLGYNYIFSASVRDKEEYLKATFDPLPQGNDLSYMDIYELKRKS